MGRGETRAVSATAGCTVVGRAGLQATGETDCDSEARFADEATAIPCCFVVRSVMRLRCLARERDGPDSAEVRKVVVALTD